VILRPSFRRLSSVVLTVAASASGVAMVSAAGTGAVPKKSAAAVQYVTKPGCGPKKTSGAAGGSGLHTGQPPKAPKAPNRQDCPVK